MSRRVVSLPALVAAGALCAACAHHPAPAAPAPTPAPVAATPPAATPAPAPAPVADNGDAARRAADAARAVLGQMAFFAYNVSDLSDADRATLDAKIPVLQANPAVQLRVDGNCDDRGSDEYNLALGERRAEASKRYLADHGIDAARLTVISYGKERPIATGDSQDAWARNRNDQFEIVAGGNQLRGAGQ